MLPHVVQWGIWEAEGFHPAQDFSCLHVWLPMKAELPAWDSSCVTLFSLLSLPAAMLSPGQTPTAGSPPRT